MNNFSSEIQALPKQEYALNGGTKLILTRFGNTIIVHKNMNITNYFSRFDLKSFNGIMD